MKRGRCVIVASSKELTVLDLGKEQQGESYYQIKGPFSPDLGVPPSYTLRTPLPQCRNLAQQYLFFFLYVSLLLWTKALATLLMYV